MVSEKVSFKNSMLQRMYGSLTFCHPAISKFSMADISFNIAYKELKFVQIAQVNQLFWLLHLVHIQLFRERLSAKMCTRQSRKVIWDMINTLFLALQLSKILLLLSFSTRKHMSMASRAILSNFCEEQRTQNHPQYLSGLSLFPTTFLEVAVYGHGVY